MNTNLQLKLEDTRNLTSSKPPSQVRFEDKMENEISNLVSIISDAFDQMRLEVDNRAMMYKNHLSKPNRMNEQIKGMIYDHYGDKVKTLTYNRFGLFVNDYVFLFKKFNNKGLPSNIRTRNSIMLTTKGSLNFPGEPEIIFIGFTVTPGYEQLKSISATKILDEEVQWSVNLEQLAGDIRRKTPMKEVKQNDELIVKAKGGGQSKTG